MAEQAAATKTKVDERLVLALAEIEWAEESLRSARELIREVFKEAVDDA